MSAVLKITDNVAPLFRHGGGGSEGFCFMTAVAATAGIIARDNHEKDRAARFLHKLISEWKIMPGFPHREWEQAIAHVEESLAQVLVPWQAGEGSGAEPSA